MLFSTTCGSHPILLFGSKNSGLDAFHFHLSIHPFFSTCLPTLRVRANCHHTNQHVGIIVGELYYVTHHAQGLSFYSISISKPSDFCTANVIMTSGLIRPCRTSKERGTGEYGKSFGKVLLNYFNFNPAVKVNRETLIDSSLKGHRCTGGPNKKVYVRPASPNQFQASL